MSYIDLFVLLFVYYCILNTLFIQKSHIIDILLPHPIPNRNPLAHEYEKNSHSLKGTQRVPVPLQWHVSCQFILSLWI